MGDTGKPDQVIEKRRVAILGSTGSIGVQTLKVIEEQADSLEAEVLTAQNNAELLIEQALKFRPNVVVIGNEALYNKVRDALAETDVKVYAGAAAIAQVVQMETVDVVLTAMVGFAGLVPTIKAIEAGKPIALANKETLVVAGELVTRLAAEKGVNIYPVDSEHSAIFQCLVGDFHNPIEKIILTASGGPFRGKKPEDLAEVGPEAALKHPNWSMGAKITIDSATLMNKGLEVIEAQWLFGLKPHQIEVIVHPQSIIHSMVQFEDGSIKAQMGLPDMKLPIQYALTYPQRLPTQFPRFDFSKYPNLSFEQPDLETFQNLGHAFRAMELGANKPCALNAANEETVAAFLKKEISFLAIAEINGAVMDTVQLREHPNLEDYLATDQEARMLARQMIESVKQKQGKGQVEAVA